MALIKCAECGNQISDQAKTCPICGRPIKEVIVTTQQTSKRWKLVKAIAWVGIIFGGIVFMNNYNKDGFDSPFTGMGFSVAFLSIIILFAGKLGAWWTNR